MLIVFEDLDQSLLSLERLEDRTSPDLWPERSMLLYLISVDNDY